MGPAAGWWWTAAAAVMAAAVTAGEVRGRDDIYFAAFFPMNTVPGAPEGSIGKGVMPAVNLAIKHINQSPSILPGYKLHMYWNDTEVNYIMLELKITATIIQSH